MSLYNLEMYWSFPKPGSDIPFIVDVGVSKPGHASI